MSDTAFALLGVVIGGLLTPFVQAVGYLVRRRLERADLYRAERRKALIEFQEALLDLTQEEASNWLQELDRGKVNQQITVAKRLVRLRAAGIGDAKLWELINSGPPSGPIVFEAGPPSPYGPGEPGDRYDAWDERIRELFDELYGKKRKRNGTDTRRS